MDERLALFLVGLLKSKAIEDGQRALVEQRRREHLDAKKRTAFNGRSRPRGTSAPSDPA